MIGSLTELRLLIVDDNEANVALIERVLSQAGYTGVLSTDDAASVTGLCDAYRPDLVVLDLHMPGMTGFDVLGRLGERLQEPDSLPVLVLTADSTPDARRRALSLGARDFVTKPIDQLEFLLRIRNLLSARQLQLALKVRNDELDELVRVRTLEVEQARLESLAVLATVAEYHDYTTHHHTQRVGATAAQIAELLGLPAQFIDLIRQAAPLHDVGKVGIPDGILLKQGKLDDHERAVVMRHVEIGAKILEPARSPVLRAAAEIARTHHERWDGTGYLLGLAGEGIPLAGRITAVADVFDALTHERPYKRAWPVHDALREIASQAGRQFDPTVVEAFLQIKPRKLTDPPLEPETAAA